MTNKEKNLIKKLIEKNRLIISKFKEEEEKWEEEQEEMYGCSLEDDYIKMLGELNSMVNCFKCECDVCNG